MFKLIFALVIGLGIGYSAGYKDAKSGKPSIIERALGKVGGANRGKSDQNLDKQADSVDPRR